MKRYILIGFLFCSLFLSAQTVLMQEKVDSVYQKSNFGVNSKHFLHSYFSFGFLFNDSQTNVVKFGGSNIISLGLRYKYRITNQFATGLELGYRYSTVSYPTEISVLKDKYHIHEFVYKWYYRINIGMRGDIMGKFIDLGLWGASNVFANHYTKTEMNTIDYKTIEFYENDLQYFEKFSYGFLLRLGINQFVIFSEYRYSNLLKESHMEINNTVPKWVVGLQIGFHR